ncbi:MULTISPECIES: EscU/YscU/HrcU family type III secretion system export apparatus switch protein [Pseudoxanthomonas]|uniref:Flagellar biosynthetic protein FlhB n=1 Tax=Pseudoxanthomonas winnipegensis TaxID=2480810 RepID=A0AAW8GET1_9GAMM|nr:MULTISPECIES: EscU/YscU/HrcU family type III secretion system export apparatus switch protein [Pseudoxanthomonas]MDQ1120680.1 flagellar biosynthetic protein FlhB [Pseudoxanthomonas winnipegensis]MDQ1133903.1 flagellar biosynthetic protein FlhB [Pseudoxanthomonas winnipegensis]MDR6139861.1 flagellar biosynthetic protein FlhB [Pseudoxanthomonas sp. SORGH_AS_0997]
MAGGDQDKSEQPTSYRLEEARKEGQVAKSADLASVLLVSVFCVVALLTAGQIGDAVSLASRRLILLAGRQPELGAGFVGWLLGCYQPVLQAMWPMLLALLVTAVAAHVLQTGPLFTSKPLGPDFKRLNPQNAVKRVLSLRTLWELAKLAAKLGLLAALGAWAALRTIERVDQFAPQTPHQLFPLLLDGFKAVALHVLPILIAIAILDVLFQRRSHLRMLKMSRRELKDEAKRRDGDPEVRSRQKQQVRELLKKVRALPKVAQADVIVTNPTHFAVALKYLPLTMRAPIVLCKGRGLLAAQIRKIAHEARVPVVSSPALARLIYKQCGIDAPVPEEAYGQLSPIYRKILAAKREARQA